eukprot:3335599-Rhodomonas_salina.1
MHFAALTHRVAVPDLACGRQELLALEAERTPRRTGECYCCETHVRVAPDTQAPRHAQQSFELNGS